MNRGQTLSCGLIHAKNKQNKKGMPTLKSEFPMPRNVAILT